MAPSTFVAQLAGAGCILGDVLCYFQVWGWFLSLFLMAEPEPGPWGSGPLTAKQGFIWRSTKIPITTGVVPECVCAAKGEGSPEPPPSCRVHQQLCLCKQGWEMPVRSLPEALLLLCMQSAGADKGKCGRGFKGMQKAHLAFFFF